VIRVEREIEVERSASEVFDRLIRIEDLPRWQPSIVEARVESPPPLAVGSRIRIVADAGGKRTVAIGTVTELERPARIGLTAQAGSADLAAAVSIGPTGAGSCRVAVATTIRLGGFLRFVEGMARSRIEAEAPAAAAAAKAWLEADENATATATASATVANPPETPVR
jgi:Polyketide cyclase / dehydrase and lipid transport